MDRPEEFASSWQYAVVTAVHPESWEVDLASEGGGFVARAVVLGPRFPEKSTIDRPQWVMWGAGAAVCIPISSRLPAPRTPRKEVVYYDEVGNYRVTINRTNEFELRNLDEDAAHRLVIQQQDGVVRIDTPSTHITIRESDSSVPVKCDKHVAVSCETARINARSRAEVVAPDVRLGDPAGQQIPLGNLFIA